MHAVSLNHRNKRVPRCIPILGALAALSASVPLLPAWPPFLPTPCNHPPPVSGPSGNVAPTPRPPYTSAATYQSFPQGDILLATFFPSSVRAENILQSYDWRTGLPNIPDRGSVVRLIMQAHGKSPTPPFDRYIGHDYMDSYWLSLGESEKAEELLASLNPAWKGQFLQVPEDMPEAPASLLEKALFQRDLFQAYSITHRAVELCSTSKYREQGSELLRSLARDLYECLFTERELDRLKSLIDSQQLASTTSPTLEDDYLPEVIVGRLENGWFQFPIPSDATHHAQVFRGRSFIRLYGRIPGWSFEQFLAYWRRAHEVHGGDTNLAANLPPLPGGSETVLVRTIGLFMTDATFVDSGLPEEVLIRILKTSEPHFDQSTSDYRGTLQYQYKLRRRKLLGDMRGLGLERIRDDDPVFWGFFSDVPDRFTAPANPLSTMRFNCIACHSPVLYGPNTIMSLRFPPPSGSLANTKGSGLLEELAVGRYRLRSSEAESLVAMFGDLAPCAEQP